MGHDSGAMTRLVDQLEARGLVTRCRNKNDRRIIDLALTTEGKAVAKSLMPRILDFWNNVLGDFSTSEVTTLISLLTRLIARIEAEPVGPPQKARSAR